MSQMPFRRAQSPELVEGDTDNPEFRIRALCEICGLKILRAARPAIPPHNLNSGIEPQISQMDTDNPEFLSAPIREIRG
jgi:hypothetical protein